MWNFKPNFEYSPLKFSGDPIPSLWCAPASLDQFLARVKISGASALKGPKFCIPKKVQMCASTCASINFVVSGPNFFRPIGDEI